MKIQTIQEMAWTTLTIVEAEELAKELAMLIRIAKTGQTATGAIHVTDTASEIQTSMIMVHA